MHAHAEAHSQAAVQAQNMVARAQAHAQAQAAAEAQAQNLALQAQNLSMQAHQLEAEASLVGSNISPPEVWHWQPAACRKAIWTSCVDVLSIAQSESDSRACYPTHVSVFEQLGVSRT